MFTLCIWLTKFEQNQTSENVYSMHMINQIEQNQTSENVYCMPRN